MLFVVLDVDAMTDTVRSNWIHTLQHIHTLFRLRNSQLSQQNIYQTVNKLGTIETDDEQYFGMTSVRDTTTL